MRLVKTDDPGTLLVVRNLKKAELSNVRSLVGKFFYFDYFDFCLFCFSVYFDLSSLIKSHFD